MARKKTTLTTQGRVVNEQVPISDNITTDWVEGAGDADGNVYDELDEGRAAFDDATTYWHATPDAAGLMPLRLKMSARDVPSDPTKMSVQVRVKAAVSDIPAFDIDIYEGGTNRATSRQALNVSEGWVTKEMGTTVDLSSITN